MVCGSGQWGYMGYHCTILSLSEILLNKKLHTQPTGIQNKAPLDSSPEWLRKIIVNRIIISGFDDKSLK